MNKQRVKSIPGRLWAMSDDQLEGVYIDFTDCHQVQTLWDEDEYQIGLWNWRHDYITEKFNSRQQMLDWMKQAIVSRIENYPEQVEWLEEVIGIHSRD